MKPSRRSSGEPEKTPAFVASSHSFRRTILKIMTWSERRFRRKAEIGAREREVLAPRILLEQLVQLHRPRLHRRSIGIARHRRDRALERAFDLGAAAIERDARKRKRVMEPDQRVVV